MQLLVAKVVIAKVVLGLCCLWLIWRGYEMRYKLQWNPPAHFRARVFADRPSWLRLSGLGHILIGVGILITLLAVYLFPHFTRQIAVAAMVTLSIGLWFIVRQLKQYE